MKKILILLILLISISPFVYGESEYKYVCNYYQDVDNSKCFDGFENKDVLIFNTDQDKSNYKYNILDDTKLIVLDNFKPEVYAIDENMAKIKCLNSNNKNKLKQGSYSCLNKLKVDVDYIEQLKPIIECGEVQTLDQLKLTREQLVEEISNADWSEKDKLYFEIEKCDGFIKLSEFSLKYSNTCNENLNNDELEIIKNNLINIRPNYNNVKVDDEIKLRIKECKELIEQNTQEQLTKKELLKNKYCEPNSVDQNLEILKTLYNPDKSLALRFYNVQEEFNLWKSCIKITSIDFGNMCNYRSDINTVKIKVDTFKIQTNLLNFKISESNLKEHVDLNLDFCKLIMLTNERGQFNQCFSNQFLNDENICKECRRNEIIIDDSKLKTRKGVKYTKRTCCSARNYVRDQHKCSPEPVNAMDEFITKTKKCSSYEEYQYEKDDAFIIRNSRCFGSERPICKTNNGIYCEKK